MSHGVWKGTISFGLVSVPVSVVSAENKTQELDFDLIDRRDHAHVGYQKINKTTGEVIESENIVKGLKLESGKYAIFESDELNRLKIRGSDTIDIQEFVPRAEVAPIYFKRFYYLVPEKAGTKAYVLLRDTLEKTQSFAVGLVVLHNRQQLAMIGAHDKALVLHVVHYAQEIKDLADVDMPAMSAKGAKISDKEMKMAESLVKEMTTEWKAKDFEDNYFAEVKDALKHKKKTDLSAPEKPEPKAAPKKRSSKVLDLMPLLEKSLKRPKSASAHPKTVRH